MTIHSPQTASIQYADIPDGVRGNPGKELLWGIMQNAAEDRDATPASVAAHKVIKAAIESVMNSGEQFDRYDEFDHAVGIAALRMAREQPGKRPASKDIFEILVGGRLTYHLYTDQGIDDPNTVSRAPRH